MSYGPKFIVRAILFLAKWIRLILSNAVTSHDLPLFDKEWEEFEDTLEDGA